MPIPRRELPELHAKYDLHPELFDIYVEGDFDYDFINLFLTTANIRTASVFSIEDIEIDAATIDKLGLQHGSNKHRVLALAKLLDMRYGTRNTNVVCLADPDRDRILNKLRQGHHSIYTDYACLECYMLNDATLQRFLTFACHLPGASGTEFLGIARSVLPVQFALRATLEALSLSEPVLGFESGLTKKRNLLTFNSEKYINSFLAHHALQASRVALVSKFREVHAALSDDLRHATQGHDFIALLFEYLWSKDSMKLHDKQESVLKFGGRLVAMSCDHLRLQAEPLFARIMTSASGATYMKP